MSVVVRFAPSPTGMLHIGSARTAVFNYLFSKKNGGKFILRIEDTDKKRSTEEANKAIINGLDWLGIKWDNEEIYYQSKFESKHVEVAKKLLAEGKAYYAYDTLEEIEAAKNLAHEKKLPYKYDGTRWKNGEKRNDVKPVLRLNIPLGKTIIDDLVYGKIEFDNETLEDFVLLRSDDTPTYMLAVVVDDITMGITHIIRGDDHISNTPKQVALYKAIGNKHPQFAHLPLIYDIEGKKLSKRKNAVAVDDYREKGYLPDAIFNYLLQLGWNDGTEKEIYSRQEAIDAFNISKIRKSPSRFDFDKLENVNLHYIKCLSDGELFKNIDYFLKQQINRELSELEIYRFKALSEELRKFSNLKDIALAFLPFLEDFSHKNISVEDRIELENKKEIVSKLQQFLKTADYFDFNTSFKAFIREEDLKMKDVCPVLRFLLIGKWHSFGYVLIINTLGKDEVLKRVLSVRI